MVAGGTYSTTVQTNDTSESDRKEKSVKGRLFSCFDYWEKILNASSFVLKIISQGYLLPLDIQPPPFYAPNNSSSLNNKKFVESEIKEYLEKSYIREIDSLSYCCNPLTVAEGSKPRLVLDLRHVNKFLNIQKFKYEDLKVVADLMQPGEYFTTFDLASAYHHIDINPMHSKFLGFQWIFPDGKTKNYQYLV